MTASSVPASRSGHTGSEPAAAGPGALAGAVWLGGPGQWFLRTTFESAPIPERAVLTIAADSHTYMWKTFGGRTRDQVDDWCLSGAWVKFRLYVNGREVTAGPPRPIADAGHVLCTIPVTEFLRPGRNVLALAVRGERLGVIARLDRSDAPPVVTGPAWRALNGCRIVSPYNWAEPGESRFTGWGAAGPGEFNEYIDGTLFPFGWTEPEFDDSSWIPAPAARLGAAAEFEACTLTPPVLTELPPRTIRHTADDRWVIDFGQESLASIRLYSPEPGCVEVRAGEELNPDGSVRYRMRTGNVYRDWMVFPKTGGSLSIFGLRAFRYVELCNYPGELKPEAIAAVALHYRFRAADSEFQSTCPALNEVWEFCKQTIRYTNYDLYCDCPSRERVAYEADGYVTMLTDFAVQRNYEFARRYIKYQLNHRNAVCEWVQIMIPLVLEYTLYSGDLTLATECYPRLAADNSLLSYVHQGVLEKPPEPLKILVDWPPACNDDYDFGEQNTVANAYLLRGFTALAEIAGWLGREADRRDWLEYARRCRTTLNRENFDPERQLYRDCRGSTHCSFHANVFALAFGVADAGRTQAPLDYLESRGMACGVYVAQHLLDALFRHGRDRQAVKLMSATGPGSWLGMREQGATLTTEAWTPEQKPNMSFAHPWGSSPGNVLIRQFFGLRPTLPGWETYEFTPHPGEVAAGRVRVPTPRGALLATFRRTPDGCVCEHEFDRVR